MPATLMSFDLDDEMSVPVKNTSSKTAHTAPKLSARIDNGDYNDEHYDDISFDDTRIETPKGIRRDRSYNASHSSVDRPNRYDVSRYTQRARTSKVPLKDDDNVSKTERQLTPSATKKNRARGNDTSPRSSLSAFSTIRHRVTQKSYDEEEAELIRNSKVISEDNQFRPFKSTSGRDVSTSNGQSVTSPRKFRSTHQNGQSVSSPRKFRSTHQNGVVEAAVDLDHADIEFDSSEAENKASESTAKHPGIKTYARDKTSPTPSKPNLGLSRRNGETAPASKEYPRKLQNESEVPEENVAENEADDDKELAQRIRSDLYQDEWTTEDIVEQMHSNISSLEKRESIRDNGVHEEEKQPSDEGYNSSDSTSDRETQGILDELESHLSKSDAAVRSDQPKSDHLGINQRLESLHSDGFVRSARNYNFRRAHPQSEPSYASNFPNIRRSHPISKRSSPVKTIEDDSLTGYAIPKKRYSELSGQYARHVLKQRRENPTLHNRPTYTRTYSTPNYPRQNAPPPRSLINTNNAPAPGRGSISPSESLFQEPPRAHNAMNQQHTSAANSSINARVGYPDWTNEKWEKLQALLDSPHIPRDALINSDKAIRGLGCRGKDELIARINYLLDLKRVGCFTKSRKRGDTKNGRVAKKTSTRKTK